MWLRCVLAQDLGMTVNQLDHDMPYEELILWAEFYKERNKRREKAQKDAARKRKAASRAKGR